MAEVETQRDGGVMTITLNRPDVLNAFDRAMQDGFRAALKEAADPEVRAVVLTGAGRGFCVGQDLKEFQEGAGDVQPQRAFAAAAREARHRRGERARRGSRSRPGRRM